MPPEIKESIAVIGSSNYDVVVKVDEIPIAGETVLANGMETGFGGKGANQAMTIARLGGDIRFFTCIGSDVFGKLYMENFKASKINLKYIEVIENEHNGIALINVDKEGRNNIVVYPGANSHLSTDMIIKNGKDIFHSKLIITQLEIPLSSVELLSKMKSEGNVFILNPSPLNKSINYDYILKNVDILVPNEVELAQLSGIKTDNIKGISKATQKLLEKGVKTIVVTLGRRGAFVKNKDIEEYLDVRDVKVVDTEGAGDIFMGSFVCSYIKNNDIIRSVKFANEVATISVTRYGTQKSIPTDDELKEIYKMFE
ncbi:MAG: ribokinase [Candidatus Humimicrobiaceae bacterium]